MRQWEDLQQGAADRLLTLVERLTEEGFENNRRVLDQSDKSIAIQAHSMSIEEKKLDAAISITNKHERRHNALLAVTLTALLPSVFLAPWQATSALAGLITAIVGAPAFMKYLEQRAPNSSKH